MTSPIVHPLAVEVRLPDMQREFLAHALDMLKASGKVDFHPEKPASQIAEQQDLHTVGAIIAKHLPDDTGIAQALRRFYNKDGPPILVLRGFPKVEANTPRAKHLMEGLGTVMSTGITDKGLAPDAHAPRAPASVLHRPVFGSESQTLHQDSMGEGAEADIVAFSCYKQGGETIVTNFTQNGSYYGMQISPRNGPSDLLQVQLNEGDIILYRNRELFHGRHNSSSKQSGDRTLHHTEFHAFTPAQLSPSWKERQKRAEELLRPRQL